MGDPGPWAWPTHDDTHGYRLNNGNMVDTKGTGSSSEQLQLPCWVGQHQIQVFAWAVGVVPRLGRCAWVQHIKVARIEVVLALDAVFLCGTQFAALALQVKVDLRGAAVHLLVLGARHEFDNGHPVQPGDAAM